MDINNYSTPINKTAALVTGQSQCDDAEYVLVCRQIEDTKDAIYRYQILLPDLKGAARKREGKRVFELQSRLSKLKIRRKELNNHHKTSIDSIMLRECMKRFSEKEWNEITAIAKQKFRSTEE